MAKKQGKKQSKKQGKKQGAPRRPSLSDVDKVFEDILLELKADQSHPRWALAVQGVAALRDLNVVLCRLIAAPLGGDSDFGFPRPRP
jgi:hypothetical protein